MKRHWVDGVPDAPLDPWDRGLHYGDGLFETLAVVAGRALHVDDHLQRLRHGLRTLAIAFPRPVDWAGEIARAASQVPTRGVLKLLVTRGPGGRGYDPAPATAPRRYLFLTPWPEALDERRAAGARLRWCRLRLAPQPRLAGIKHLNRLEQVLARAEWSDPAVDEGLLLDPDGWVVEGTRSNLFLVRDGVLVTPLLDRCGVAGVTRARILAQARRLKIPLEERRVAPEELSLAEEVFLSNSLMGIWPVRCLEERRYPVPGPLTRRLQGHLPCP